MASSCDGGLGSRNSHDGVCSCYITVHGDGSRIGLRHDVPLAWTSQQHCHRLRMSPWPRRPQERPYPSSAAWCRMRALSALLARLFRALCFGRFSRPVPSFPPGRSAAPPERRAYHSSLGPAPKQRRHSAAISPPWWILVEFSWMSPVDDISCRHSAICLILWMCGKTTPAGSNRSY